MGKIIVVLGGARSGKSAFAEELAGRDRKVAYVATATPLDEEMHERIRRHRLRRPKGWVTYEQPLEIAELLPTLSEGYESVLVDCMTLYVTNMLLTDALERESEAGVLSAIDRFLRACAAVRSDVIVVSGEVGCGVVPADEMARRFCDVMGLVNQRLAKHADEVYHVIAGIGRRIKPVGGDA